MSIVTASISGNYAYKAAYVGTPDTDSSNAAKRRARGSCPLFAMKGVTQTSNDNTVSVVVESGVPFIFGFASTDSGGFPHNSNISVTDPNGDPVQGDQATDDVLIVMNGSSVQLFLIANPIPGTWTLTAKNLPSNDAHVFLSTTPTQDVYQTMIAAIQPHINEDVAGVTEEDNSWVCWACTVAAWTIGLAVAALVALGIAAITVESGAVVLLAAFVAVAAATAWAWLIVLITIAGGVVEILVANFCGWTGACDNDGITATLVKPANGAQLNGPYQCEADTTGNTEKVYFFVDSAVIGTNPGSTPYHMNFDTTKFANGSHTLSAMAVSGTTTAASTPVTATFDN